MIGKLLKLLLDGRKKSSKPTAHAKPAAGSAGFVAFIADIDEPVFLGPGETLESAQASMRLRVAIPARELARRYSVCLVPIDYVVSDPTLAGLGTVRAIVVGKTPVIFFTERPERAEALVSWVETMAPRERMVVDFSDDLAAAAALSLQPALVGFQRRLLRACPATVPSNALGARLAREAGHAITVIEDPYESLAAGAPRFAPGTTLRLVWFGIFDQPLRAFLEAQFATIARRITGRPIELAFVTYADRKSEAAELGHALQAVNPAFFLRHVPWSLEAAAAELERADLVVLPQDAASDWGRVKSHYRLVESIRAGRFAVASPIPSYVELANYAWIGNDLAAGVAWALDHPQEVERRLAEGQAYVAERFSPGRVAEKWAEVLGITETATS